MEIEIRVNGKLWIEMNLEETLGRSAIEELDKVFGKVTTDKNRDKIIGFSRNPKALN